MPQPSPASPQRPPALRDNTRSSSLEDDLSHLAGPGHGSGTAFLSSLRHNPSLAPFLKPHFDAASFSAQVVVADSAAGAGAAGIGLSSSSSASVRSRVEVMVAQLTEQLGQAEAAIEKHILQHQKQLMQGMGDLGELRENCDVLTIRSKELRRSVNKLTAELLEPYQGTERRTQQLRRLHEANDILKKVSRFSSTLARLKKETSSGSSSGNDSAGGGNDDSVVAVEGLGLRDLAKAAQHLQEVEALFQDPILGGISLLAAERPYVTALGKGLRRTARNSLLAALQSMNQADLGPALQVFYNLRHLAPVVLECISTVVAEATDATRRAFDPQTLEKVASVSSSTSASPPSSSSSSSSSSPTGASASGRTSTAELEAIALRQRRARFRDHCDNWATALYGCAIKIWHLQRVLHKKVDATTNEGFLDVVLQSTDFQKALEHALLASPAGAASSKTGLKRGHSRGSSNGGGNGNNNSSSSSGPNPSSVGALYWMFWLELTAAIRTIAEKAAKRASPSLTTSSSTAAAAAANAAGAAPVIKCYPYILLGLTDVLDKLVESTSKHKVGSLTSTSGAGGGSHHQQQGNPAALRALMEALGVDEHTNSAMLIEGEEQHQQQQPQQQQQGAAASLPSSSVLFLPDQAGGSAAERTSLIEALGSLRDLYLGDSLQRLCRPIELMFPSQEGFSAAVPSKHDLQALFRVMQSELLTGLAEGGPLLLPHLVRGVVKAVHLFCTKVEAMTNTSEGARKLYALRGWMLGPEKEHNLQLLQLVAFLHQGLKRLPQDLAAAVGGGREGGRGEEALLMEAATALETLAVTGFVHPYMMDIAAELGGTLAEMHLENYAPGKQQQQRLEEQQQLQGDSDGQGGGGNSRFITAFQTAVTGLRKHHLSKFPMQADFVLRAFEWLTGRLLRLYVSHAALLRPLNEAGKTKLTNDMAMLETCLSSIHPKLSELGAPYLELKAFRELCFYGDEQNPLTVNGLAKERFTAHLRPSTLLDALFARAPLELSSPHVLQRCSERTLAEELLTLYYKDGGGGGGREGGEGGDSRMLAESAHWQVVQVCLDAYAQRMSASQAHLAYIYDVMLNLGGLLLKGFEDRLGKEGRDAAGRQGKDGGRSSVAAGMLPLNW